MRRKLVKLLLLVIIAFFSVQLKVQAAIITSTDHQVKSDSGSVTVSVTSKQALGAFELKLIDTAGLTLLNTTKGSDSFEVTGDKLTITGSSSNGITELGSFTFKVPAVTADTTYKIKFLVSKMETTNLEMINDENNTATITVKAQEEQKKSSEARLSNLGIKPNDFSGFKKDTYQYTATVPNNVSEVEIYAEKLHDKATIEGTGKVSLKEGSNPFKVKVTAEDGTTKEYTLTINRKTAAEEEAENGEARLKSLGIKPKEYDFTGFDSEKKEYTAEVPNEIEEIEVYATAKDSKAQITGIGMITLEEGVNELKIEVIAVNGTKETYTLTVTRKEAETTVEPTEEKLGLTTLSILGVTLNPKFDTETYEYKIDLTEDLNSLDIATKANDEEATIEIIGNENFKDGENVITILVKNEETEENATYQIIVNKNVVIEEVVMSWLKPSTWGKEETIKIIIIVVLIILIISAVVLKINIAKESEIERKLDLPGAEELNKAMAEHQELAEEEMNCEEVTVPTTMIAEKEEIKANYLEEIARTRATETENTVIFEEEIIRKPKRRGKHF